MSNEENRNPQLEKGLNSSSKAKKSNNNHVNRGNYLWENDIHLEQVRRFLYSQDSWLNENETEFVRQSVIRKWKVDFQLSVLATSVIVGALILTGAAWRGQRQASIRKVHALTQSAEAKLQSKNDLDAAVDILRARKAIQEFWFNKPETELAEVQGTLHKVFYAASERNRLQNRGSVYDIALSSDGKLLAVVGKNDTVFTYQVPLNNKSWIHKLWTYDPTRSFLRYIPVVGQLTVSNKLDQRDSFSTGQGDVHTVAFLNISDKRLLATGAEDGTVKLWEIEQDGRIHSSEIYTIPPSNSKEQNSVSALASKGEKLAIGREDGTVNLWTTTSKEYKNINDKNSQLIPLQKTAQKQKLELEPVYGMAFSSKGRLAILRVNKFEIWDTTKNNSETVYTIPDKPEENDEGNSEPFTPNEVYSVAFTTDDKLAIGKDDGTLTTFSIKPEENNKIKLTKNSTENNKKEPIPTEQGTVYSMAFSSDRKLVTLGADDRVILWDISSKSYKRIGKIQPQEETAPIQSMASSLDGKMLATGDENGTVRLWDASGKPIRRINTEQEYVWDLALSPNGKLVATVGEDDRVSIWDAVGDQQPGEEFSTKQTSVYSVAFTPDNELATGGQDGTVKLWKIDDRSKTVTEDTQKPIDIGQGIIHSLAFSPDKQQIATLIERPDQQDELILWSNNNNNWTQKELIPLSRRNAGNKNVAFRSNGLLAISQANNIVDFWDINIKEWVGSLETQQGNIRALTYTSDNLLATAGEDGLVKLWNLSINQPKQFQLLSSQLKSIVFSHDGTRVATIEKNKTEENKTFKLWEISANNERKQLDLIITEPTQEQNQQPKQYLHGIDNASFSPNGNQLATIDIHKKVKLWDITEGKAKQIDLKEENQQPNGKKEPTLTQLDVTSVAFSPDGNQLATIDIHKKVNLWNISNGQAELLFPKAEDQQSNGEQELTRVKVTHVAFSPNDDQLVTIDHSDDNNDNTVHLWDISQGAPKLKDSIPTEQNRLTSTAFRPESNQLVTGAEDGTLRLGDTSGKLFHQINTLQGKVKSVVFSSDGKLLATIGEKKELGNTTNQEPDQEPEKTLKVWQILDNKIRPFKAEQSGISSAAFNPDSTQIATVKQNGWVNLWQLGGKEINNDNQLVKGVCDLVRDYLENSPDLEPSDRDLCPKPDDNQTLTSTNFNQSTESDAIATDQTSTGNKILVSTPTNPDKQFAAQMFAAGNFETAASYLADSLQTNRNDPEALIYLNNARIGALKSYTIAVPVPITSNPNGALEILRGVAQAQDGINRTGGINGVPLRVLIADDQGDEKAAQQLAQQLADNPHVLGVVGHFASGVTKVAGAIYNKNKLVAISPVSTAIDLGFREYVLRTVPNDQKAAKALASQIVKSNLKNAVVFYNSQSPYSESLGEQFKDALRTKGGQVQDWVDLSQPNFKATQEVKKAKQKGADTLVLLADTTKLDEALAVAKANADPKLGVPLKLFAGDDVYTWKTLDLGRKAVDGMVLAVPWQIDSHLVPPEFREESYNLWGGATVNWRTAMSYDAAQAFIQALKNIQKRGETPTREALANELRSNHFKACGASRRIEFDSSGDRDQESQLVVVESSSNSRSKTGYDFKVLKTAEQAKVQDCSQKAPSPTPSSNNRQDVPSSSVPSKVQSRPQKAPSPTPASKKGQNSYKPPISNSRQANTLNSTSVDAYINQGLTYHRQRNYQQAISNYSQAIALNPNSAKAYSNRAAAYNEQKDYPKAIADSSKAISLIPNYANAYINRGLAYYHQGKYQEAIANYNKAIKLDPNNANAYHNRALAYTRLGNQQAAQANQRKAAELSQRQLR